MFGSVFSFELDSNFHSSEVVTVRIDWICLGLKELYSLEITLAGAFNVIEEFLIPKMCNTLRK